MAGQMTGTSRLVMQGIAKRFGATVALAGVDFDVQAGEIHALVGENGAGKSTLMKILAGALSPDAGSMQLDGSPYRPRNPHEARRAGIAMIYQELALAPHLTVEENIVLGAEPTRRGLLRRNEMRRIAVQALSHFGGQSIPPDVPVSRLTVNAKQLVEIARALAVGCKVLILDEPTSSLSRDETDRLFAILRSLKERGLSIVYISHFLEEVQQIADRLTVLRDGMAVGTYPLSAVTTEQIVRMMVGREVDELYPHSPRTRGELVLEVRALSGRQKPIHASFELYRGEVVGIAGLIGAGRTELLRVIFGLDPVRSGEVRVGVYCGPASPVERWAQGVGFLSEDRKEEGLVPHFGVAENLLLSKLGQSRALSVTTPRARRMQAEAIIRTLGIRCNSPDQRVVHLSGGNQQKVALGRLLAHDVDVLLLDEPTKGVDVAAKATIYQIIDGLATGRLSPDGRPKAVLLVSSYLPELMGICDRIAVMHRGRLGPALAVEELDEHRLMHAATVNEATT
ncbi:MAG: sugar ABC transporter ATP-binding protein [Calditrichaeota bacterium]|nr:sugar ABC transporter ATP-binding protein [Calditrichota bacterium]